MPECDYCGEPITRRDKRKRGEHIFCCHSCFGAFSSQQRENNCCKRCGVRRKGLWNPFFTRGYCQRCYGLLLKYNFNEELAELHELTQDLMEAVNASR